MSERRSADSQRKKKRKTDRVWERTKGVRRRDGRKAERRAKGRWSRKIQRTRNRLPEGRKSNAARQETSRAARRGLSQADVEKDGRRRDKAGWT